MAEKWICKKRVFKDTWIKKLHGDKFMQITDGTIPGLYLRQWLNLSMDMRHWLK